MVVNVNEFLLEKADYLKTLQIAITQKDVEKIRYILRTSYKKYKFDSEIDIDYLCEKIGDNK